MRGPKMEVIKKIGPNKVSIANATTVLIDGDSDRVGYRPDQKMTLEKLTLKFSSSITLGAGKRLELYVRHPDFTDPETPTFLEVEAWPRISSGSGTDFVFKRKNSDPEMFLDEQFKLVAQNLEDGTPDVEVIAHLKRAPL